MSKQAIIKELQQLLADVYGLYLKTQNYHWHIKGPHFKQLHEFFNEQYDSLAGFIDSIAERILTLGGHAPATFKSLSSITNISDGDSNLTWQNMISDLASDQDKIVNSLMSAFKVASSAHDEATVDFIAEKIGYFEKQRWMLESHLE